MIAVGFTRLRMRAGRCNRAKVHFKTKENVTYAVLSPLYNYSIVLSFIMFFNREGEKWYNLRAVLNKRMLHPKDSVQYGDVINEVVTDFIKRIYYLREVSPTGDLVPDFANELYRFSLEGIHVQNSLTRVPVTPAVEHGFDFQEAQTVKMYNLGA